MAIDPVCKMKVDEQSAAGQTNYNGKEYYFCSKDCEQKFEKDPSQFAEAAA
jgi:YHS domain-containing protein